MPTSQRRSRNWHRRRRNRALLRTGILAAAVSVMVIFGWGIGYLARELQDRFANGIYTIAVDAGHGGGDTGAVGVLRESDMTAQTAALLTQRLAADPHFHPVATRPEDTAATPAERSAAANQKHPDLLLSIHGNSDGNSADTAGFECYPVTPGRKEHDDSMRFASLLVQRMQAAGASIRGTNGIRYAYYDENDQKTIVDSADDTPRSETTFTILERSRCPAVLAEQCFVTSAADVDAFGDADGCARAAECYYLAICDYFDVTPYDAAASAPAPSA